LDIDIGFKGLLTDIVSWFFGYWTLPRAFLVFWIFGAEHRWILETVSINQHYKNSYSQVWIQEQNCPI
jgi:hypothetical protein